MPFKGTRTFPWIKRVSEAEAAAARDLARAKAAPEGQAIDLVNGSEKVNNLAAVVGRPDLFVEALLPDEEEKELEKELALLVQEEWEKTASLAEKQMMKALEFERKFNKRLEAYAEAKRKFHRQPTERLKAQALAKALAKAKVAEGYRMMWQASLKKATEMGITDEQVNALERMHVGGKKCTRKRSTRKRSTRKRSTRKRSTRRRSTRRRSMCKTKTRHKKRTGSKRKKKSHTRKR